MRRTVLAAAICLLVATAASGQWLEKTIRLSDSIYRVRHSGVVLHNPTTNRMYFAGSDAKWVQILDASTREKLGCIDAVENVSDLILCPGPQRIYCPSWNEEQLLVLDSRNDSVLHVFDDIPAYTGAYNSLMNKVYVAGGRPDGVFVFRAGVDTLIAEIEVDEETFSVVWDSVHNRVFVVQEDGGELAIAVIDCEADTLLTYLSGPDDRAVDLALHKELGKLYCLGYSDLRAQTEVWVYDAGSLVTLDTIALPIDVETGQLVLNPLTDYLYAAIMDNLDDADDTLAVINCLTDSLVALVEFPSDCEIDRICVNETDGRVYVCGCDMDSVAVLAVPDSITNWIPGTGEVSGIGWNSTDNEAYLVSHSDSVLVVEGATDSIVARIGYSEVLVSSMFWNPAGNKLYVWSNEGLGLLGANGSVEQWLPDLGLPVAHWPELNRLYLGSVWGATGMSVYDCNLDSVVKVVETPTGKALVVPELHKMYMTRQNVTYIYDLYLDSVISEKSGWGELAYNPRNGLLYGHGGSHSSITIIDSREDTIIKWLWNNKSPSLVVNSVDNEVYFLQHYRQDLVHVLDGATHGVVDTIVLPAPATQLLWLEGPNKLYCIADTVIMAVDCASRRCLRTMRHNAWGVRQWYVNERNDKLWLGGSGGLVVVNCRWDSIVASFDLPSGALTWNAIENRTYTAERNRIYVFRDAMTGIQEMPNVEVRMPNATILRGVLRLPEASGVGRHASSVLLDITGRKVMDLHPGANDIRHVAPGVYFVVPPHLNPLPGGERRKERGPASGVERGASCVRKVVIQR